ncbi:Importin-beta protein [Dictyocaulus viviparus]|uniref:Importin-beta protein n=1 Tax=Dictyocaulus viviparus TaxID=29172 RepID=A0A0D8Y3U0_DICVI|nr:Importin-beta protein [Dictyocaulus viviparus]
MAALTATPMVILEEAKKQFQEDGKLNVQLLDQVVTMMNRATGEEQKIANMILVELKENPNSWTKVDAILEYSDLAESKYFALQILESVIQTKWKSLPLVQRDGIKGFIVQFILKLSESRIESEKNPLLLHKLNLVLVQIVKQDWPKNWPSFITDIVESSKTNDSICVNNMNILSLLSEEVFDFGSQHLTQAKEQHLKQQFCGQFQEVFTLCITILEKCPANSIVEATLKTLHRFLSWIPVGYVFETNITQLLSENFLSLEVYRVVTLQCLTEISMIQIETEDNSYKDKLCAMFCATIKEIGSLLGERANLATAYQNGTDEDQKFISCLAQFLVAFLKDHSALVESPNPVCPQVTEYHMYAIELLLSISQVEDVEIFKVCLDYWCALTSELYRLNPFAPPSPPIAISFSCGGACAGKEHPRRKLYKEHLSNLRTIMISRMAKPEEVLVVENDQGEVVREIVKDTDSITLYKNMRECLVYLTHLDCKDTEQKMTEKLASQVNGSEFSWKNLNTLCWAVGSISGTMVEEDEKRFLVLVIRDLLGLCEQKRGKDNKAVIASNIMYVVGQYPRFLRAHWKFLKTVINKLFEFMHETHEGVQDMACDTFIKIAMKCKRHFVIMQFGEQTPFIDEMLKNLSGIICDLAPSQVHVFYEAVGHIISSASDEPNQQADLIEKLMALPNSVWDEIIANAGENMSVLEDQEVVRNLLNILKTNVACCKATGNPFITQLSRLYIDLLSLYRILSEKVSTAVEQNGQEVLKMPLLKTMRAVKREILILISTWVASAKDKQMVLENIVPPLFDAVLFDYQKNVPAAREPKVLSLLSIIVTKLGSMLASQVPQILAAVFECTLAMINKDMEAFPEHRTNFFQLIHALTVECFQVFLALPQEQLSYIIDAVVWAFQHSMRNVAEIGLDILKDMLDRVEYLPRHQSQPFYKRFYMQILQHVLAVVADSSQVHVAGVTYYAEVLCRLFKACEFLITVPLNDENPEQSNVDYIYEYIANIFVQHFTNLTEDQIRVIIKGFFSFNTDPSGMRNHLRDFLVQIKEFNGEDTSDLFLEEREAEIQAAQAKKNAIPGMCGPNNIVDEDEMH